MRGHAHTRSLYLAVLAGLALAVLNDTPATAADEPPMSRHEIVARAESALGADYTWGQESWVPNAPGAGPDCSGLVLKCWEVPGSLLYQEEDGVNATISPRYTTYHFYNNLGPWSGLSSRSNLLPGDAMVRYDGSSGHVVLYAEGDAWGYPVVYEAPYTGATVRRASRYLDDSYRPRRRDSLGYTTILLDNPTAKSTGGGDIDGTWTRSASVSGFLGADYQVHAGTTTAAWARWTPRLPAADDYDIYLRWTSAVNRASNAKVTVNTPSGQVVKYVDQRKNGGLWVKLGTYALRAGYATGSGSVAVHATGADGFVVADAVLFVPR